MPWEYPREDYKEYERNPLVSTDIELRFHPILAITEDPSKLVRLQDMLRKDFPEFSSNNTRAVSFEDQIVIEDEKYHVFSRENGEVTLYIGRQSIRSSSTRHRNKAEAIESFRMGLCALEECFGGIKRKRLGVRYVNLVNKQTVAEDLQIDASEIGWPDIISSDYLKSPGDVVDLLKSSFVTQIKSSHQEGGDLILRYGLMKSHPDSGLEFRFDVDRCTNDISDDEDIFALIDQYAIDIYCLFHTMVGAKLKEWMQMEG